MGNNDIRKLKHHGRETYAVYYGDGFVLKRPLPNMSDEECAKWLQKQHKTKDAIDAIRAVGNPVYNIPEMVFIRDDEYQILEERAPGKPLTSDLYRMLSRRQQYEIINSIGSFLVDMNELKPVGQPVEHKISDELKFARLNNFVNTKMSNWFNKNEVRQITRICDTIGKFSYTTRMAWSHCDLNSGNVFYDPKTSRLSFIDFAEADYFFIYRDIFAPLQIELGICRPVYETYTKLHNKSLYAMPSIKNENLREIMKNRIIVVCLKRFIKASDDLRSNPKNEKSVNNNALKLEFMRAQITAIQNIEKQFSK